MHERSLAEALMRQVDRLVLENGASRATIIRATVGEFAGVERELFHIALQDAIASTPHHGASLEISSAPLRARCGGCADQFLVRNFRFICPACGAADTHVIGGEELVLQNVTMETCRS